MIDREEFVAKGLKEESPNIYSIVFTMNQMILNGVSQPQSFTLVMEVDNLEENELGTFIESKIDNKIIRTGYYTSVDDLLSDIKV